MAFRSGPIVPTATMLANLTVASMAVFTVTLVAPAATAEIGMHATAVGFYVAAVYGFGVLSGLLTAAFVTRLGPIRVCQITMLLISASLGLLSLSTPASAVLSAVLLGLAYGTLNPASARVLSSVSTTHLQPLIFSIKQSGVPLGGVLAGAVVPTLVMAFDWQAAVLMVGGAGIAVALLSQSLRHDFDGNRRPKAAIRVTAITESLKLVLRFPALRSLSIISVAYAGCQICIGTFFVVYLTSTMAFSLIDAGVAFTYLQVGGFVGRLFWGAVAERLLPAWLVIVGLGLLMACLVGVLAIASPLWSTQTYGALSFCIGMTCYGWNGLFFSQIASVAPNGRCEDATGGVQSLMFAGIVIFPLFFAVMVVGVGYTAAFLFIGTLVLVTALWAPRPARARPTEGAPSLLE